MLDKKRSTPASQWNIGVRPTPWLRALPGVRPGSKTRSIGVGHPPVSGSSRGHRPEGALKQCSGLGMTTFHNQLVRAAVETRLHGSTHYRAAQHSRHLRRAVLARLSKAYTIQPCNVGMSDIERGRTIPTLACFDAPRRHPLRSPKRQWPEFSRVRCGVSHYVANPLDLGLRTKSNSPNRHHRRRAQELGNSSGCDGAPVLPASHPGRNWLGGAQENDIATRLGP
jgi:hypothetical protein